MPQSLLAFDTDRIKSYVFATSKLKEIRGASAILDELNQVEMVKEVEKLGGEKIYANGGSGLFLIDSAKAEDAKIAVEKLYRDRSAGNASVTGVCVELSPDYKADDNIQLYFRTMGYRLRAAKDSKAGQAALVTHPYLRFCDSCGVEYGANDYLENDETSLLCASCITKREKDIQIKTSIHQITKNVIDGSVAQKMGLWENLIPTLGKHNYVINGNRPDDFNDLADMSHPKHYIGLIYADGDSMGKALEQLESKNDFKRFSEAVDGSIYEAVAEAIIKHLQPGDRKTWPFDILLLGGDDLVMVTPADKALEVGLMIMEQFSRLTSEKLKSKQELNLSVGIAIAHANYPFGQLLQLAESALKFAKKEGAERRRIGKEWQGGLLNFVVVSSANHLEFEEFYHEELTAHAEISDENSQNPKNLFRTLRPYNAIDFRKLLGFVQNKPLSNAPHSKLQNLRNIVFQSKTQAMIDGLTMLFHWRNNKQRQEIQEVVVEFARRNQNGQAHGLLFPWYQTGSKAEPKFYTPLLDMVEIFDFVPLSQREEDNE